MTVDELTRAARRMAAAADAAAEQFVRLMVSLAPAAAELRAAERRYGRYRRSVPVAGPRRPYRHGRGRRNVTAPWLLMRRPGGLLMMPLRSDDDPVRVGGRIAEIMDPGHVTSAEWCVVAHEATGRAMPRWPNPEPWAVLVSPERDTQRAGP